MKEMGLTEEDIYKMDHQFFRKVSNEGLEIVEIQGRLYNKNLMAHYRETKENFENTKNKNYSMKTHHKQH